MTDETKSPAEDKTNGTPQPRRRGKRGVPETMEAPRPVPRLRGDGPICKVCGSGMVADGLVASNHPIRDMYEPRIRYWKCMNPRCGERTKL
jgi:hypothetical protein